MPPRQRPNTRKPNLRIVEIEDTSAPQAPAIAAGDVVMLKSGSRPMTVRALLVKDGVACAEVLFSPSGYDGPRPPFQQDQVPVSCLMPQPPQTDYTA